MWNIRCYVSESGRNQISEWYNAQSSAVQATFDMAMSYLVDQPRDGWVDPSAKRLAGGGCKGLTEIRFKAEKTQIRPLGFFGPEANEFTILFNAIEKGGDFVPKDSCKQASKRRKYVESDKDKFTCRCFCKRSGFNCCETESKGIQTRIC